VSTADVAVQTDDRAWPILTGREREVLALVVGGATNRQIAGALVLSEGTAANHVRRILLKLGLRSRTQLAVWGIRHGATSATAVAAVDPADRPDEERGPGGLVAKVVFVVGRDRGTRGALTGALVRALGVQAVSISGGVVAAAWTRSLRPALVLVDARAPRDETVELVWRLRADPVTAGTVILALGGPGAAVPSGCDGVVEDRTPGAVVDAVRCWLLGTARSHVPRPAARPSA
jgi:DNA-binding NarL/FixJ family response regulator